MAYKKESLTYMLKSAIMNRKEFFTNAAIFTGAMVIPDLDKLAIPNLTDPIKKEFVKDFVGASHSNYDKVHEMLEEYPNLINSCWDWGKGDFETGLGAASHVGNKKVAKYLLDKGARVDIFALTMLGKTDLVKPIIEAYPKFVHVAGPHGFTLLHHAKMGGKDSEELFYYFKEKGMKEYKVALL